MTNNDLKKRTQRTAELYFSDVTDEKPYALWKAFDGPLAREMSLFITGGMYSRERLPHSQRQLVTISALTALCHPEELQLHIQAALNVGCTPGEIAETIFQTLTYAGVPAANRALKVLRDVMQAKGLWPPEAEREMAAYLSPSFVIESGHAAIAGVAGSLAEGLAARDRAVILFSHVRDHIAWNPGTVSVSLDDYRASRTLEREKGSSVHQAVLLTALLRAAGIPARMKFARIRCHGAVQAGLTAGGDDLFPCHACNQIFLHGRWLNADAGFDPAACERRGFAPVEFDGRSDALLPAADSDGKPLVEYLDVGEPHRDLPLDRIANRLARTTPSRSVSHE